MNANSVDRMNTERSARGEESFWRLLGAVFRRRRLVIGFTAVAAVASVVISLLIPNTYRASSRLLLPESSGGGMASALLGDIGSAAQSLLGGGAGDYMRYIAIMRSRRVRTEIVESFDLVRVYDLADSEAPLEDALDLLSERIEFVVDNEYDFLSIEVVDGDPDRAAAMANRLVVLLDSINNELASGTAARFRRYVESRYEDAELQRAALLDSIRAFQERYGVFDLQAQTEAFFSQVAELRVNALQAEIEYEAARNLLGPENRNLAAMSEIVAASNRKYEAAIRGREQVLPIAQSQMPNVVRRYLDLELDRAIQEKILTFVAPMLEQARFEEQRTVEALQTVDPAVPPVRKDGPKRSVICVAGTLSAFILVVFYVLLMDWWRRRHAYFASRLRESSAG